MMNLGRLPVLIISSHGDHLRCESTLPDCGSASLGTAIMSVETIASILEFHKLDNNGSNWHDIGTQSRIPMLDPSTSNDFNKNLFNWIEEKI